MRRSRAGPAAVHPVPIVPHLPGTCIAPRRAGPDAAFPASCRALRCDEAEKRRLLKQALGRTAAPKRPAAAKGPAKHNIRLRQVSGGNAGAGGAQQGKTHACNRQAALCLAVPACPFACACGAKAPCRMFSCTARLAACTAAGAPLRVHRPFSRFYAALLYAFAGRAYYTRKYAQSPLIFLGNECKAVRRKYT